MAFDVYPDPPTAPLSLAKGVPSALIPFTEHAAIDPATGRNTMYIALIKLGSGSASPGPPAPTIRLQVNAGTPVDIGTDTPLPNADQPVALATRTSAGPDRFLIEIEILQANNTWQLQLLHSGPADTHEFTWVVADTKSQVEQSWINAPRSVVTFEVFTAEQESKTVQILNNGTGSLTLSDPDHTNLTHGFTLDTLTPRTVPPHGNAQATITFTGPTAPGPSNVEWTIASNDPRATTQQGHNKLVKLAAITSRPLPTGTIITLERNEADAIELFQIDPGSGTRTRLEFRAGALRSRAATIAADGSILVAGRRPIEDVGEIVRVDPNGGQQAVVSSAQMLVKPAGVAVEDGGGILVADEDGFGGKGGVIRIDPATGDQNPLAIGGGVFRSPVAIAVTADSVLVLAKTPGGDFGLFRIDPRTGAPRALSALASRSAFGLLAEDDGRVVVAKFSESTGGSVVRVRPVSGLQDTLAASRSLHAVGLAVEPDRHILIADDGHAGAGGVFRMAPGGGPPSVLSASAHPHRGPHAIAVVPAPRH